MLTQVPLGCFETQIYVVISNLMPSNLGLLSPCLVYIYVSSQKSQPINPMAMGAHNQLAEWAMSLTCLFLLGHPSMPQLYAIFSYLHIILHVDEK